MKNQTVVTTTRLILHQWRQEDYEPFAAMNADPRVMEYFPGLKTRAESDASVKLMAAHIDKHGWGLWAASLIQTGEFIGFIGLEDVHFQTSFTPAVEIGWRLAFDYWGKGYATEGALASLEYGFKKLNLREVVSFTAVQNMRSRAVMKRIGMHHDPKDDFDHPKIPVGHALRRHVLYRIQANEWQNGLRAVSLESLEDSTLAEATSFLKEHEDFSLFLLGNLEAHGPKLTMAPNSGNFKLIRFKGKIVAVFCLTRRGNLVVQSILSADWVLEKILDACQEEGRPILGLLGEWSFCQRLWGLFKKKGIIRSESFISKEILYTVDLKKRSLLGSPNVRLLTPEDYPRWNLLHIEYLKEEGLPNDLSEQQNHELFLEKVRNKISWGYFLDQQLVAVAEFNAKAMDLGQVGGVYTNPAHRRKGFAKEVMHQLIKDAAKIHQIRKLIIFTGDTNHPARKLYESLDVHPVGYYALMFGSNHDN